MVALFSTAALRVKCDSLENTLRDLETAKVDLTQKLENAETELAETQTAVAEKESEIEELIKNAETSQGFEQTVCCSMRHISSVYPAADFLEVHRCSMLWDRHLVASINACVFGAVSAPA